MRNVVTITSNSGSGLRAPEHLGLHLLDSIHDCNSIVLSLVNNDNNRCTSGLAESIGIIDQLLESKNMRKKKKHCFFKKLGRDIGYTDPITLSLVGRLSCHNIHTRLPQPCFVVEWLKRCKFCKKLSL